MEALDSVEVNVRLGDVASAEKDGTVSTEFLILRSVAITNRE
jgi:hypothetical protein